MIFLFLLTLFVVPYLVGSAIVIIFGERSHRGPVRWSVGAVTLIIFFFGCLLWALKFDYTLDQLCQIYRLLAISLSVGAFPVVIYAIKHHELTYQSFDKKVLIWTVPAIILGVFSVFILVPCYVNDITVETIRTTLSTGTIYEYSSVMGTKMEAGLPIFNKIEVLPILYAFLCRTFELEPLFLVNYVMPVCTYTANMFVMWELSKHVVKKELRNVFMLFHLSILIAGTYLPKTAFPVTAGQPLLMQGYSGYAWAFGVVMPLVLLMMFCKRRNLCLGLFLAMVGLMRYDRIFYAGKEFLTSYHSINTAGKLWILYVTSLIWWMIRYGKGTKIHPHILLSGSTLISATLTDSYDRIGRKKSFVVLSIIIILSCCSFIPFEGSTTVFAKDEIDYETILNGRDNVTLWAPNSIMSRTRRERDNVKLLYGRDLYEDMIDGVNYEPYTDDIEELYYAMSLLDWYMDDYIEELLTPILTRNTALGRVDVIVIPLRNFSDKVNMMLVKRGFTYAQECGDYLVMRRYD